MAKVFIAGHGRMRTAGSDANSQTVPQGVTVYWAVTKGYNGSFGLSSALLRGEYNQWAETKSAGSPYLEHYLCPDGSDIMSRKGEAFVAGPWDPPASHYLLQPKLKFSVSLSSILVFLKRKIPGPLEVYWTCCRSPIGEPSRMIVEYNEGTVTEVPTGGGKNIAAPDGLHSTRSVTGKVGRGGFLATKDHDRQVCISSIDGGVTIKSKADGGLALPETWPGIYEATATHTTDPMKGNRKRSSSFGKSGEIY